MGTLHTPLASPFTLLSALRAEIDENGVRHVLMCRMILGNTETIPPASKQLQPSSTDFDSGIDNPLEPTKYIVWTAYMNTHIFPAYIISFTLPGWGRRNWSSANKPTSPSMQFSRGCCLLQRCASFQTITMNFRQIRLIGLSSLED